MINRMIKTLVIVLANSFAPVALAVQLVKEREPKADAKRQQHLAGCGPGVYWLSKGMWDTLVVLFPSLLSIVYCAFDPQLSNGDSATVVCTSLILAYTFAVLPLSYAISSRYDSHSKAQTAVLTCLLVGGTGVSIVGFVIRSISGAATRRLVLVDLDWVFLLSPGYALQAGLMNVAMRQYDYFDYKDTPSVLQSSCYTPGYDYDAETAIYPYERHCFYNRVPGCCDPLPDDFVVGM